MAKAKTNSGQLAELLLQALETEAGGMEIYRTALGCAQNEDLREEWQEYLEQTTQHHQVMLSVFEDLGLDAQANSPGRDVVRHIGESLVKAMRMAKNAGTPAAAELVACECVVLAETKDHMNWELIGHIAERIGGNEAAVLKRAHEAVESDEDHHLYHTRGWCRELWIDSLGFPAVLPPPEEVKNVETAIGAARAENARDSMLKGRRK